MTRLRPARPDEEALVAGWAPASEYEDFSGDEGGHVERPAGWGQLLVADDDDRPIGDVTWRQVHWGPTVSSTALEIGISLRPEARGRGHGTRAQRLLAEYLFTTFGVHRVQATTDVENDAERRALAAAGFAFEGVLRGAQWRAGAFHDLAMYARVRG